MSSDCRSSTAGNSASICSAIHQCSRRRSKSTTMVCACGLPGSIAAVPGGATPMTRDVLVNIGAQSDAEDGGRGEAKKKAGKSGGFQSMGLSAGILGGIMKMGYKVPTPIQRKALPVALSGRDIVAMARTGTLPARDGLRLCVGVGADAPVSRRRLSQQ